MTGKKMCWGYNILYIYHQIKSTDTWNENIWVVVVFMRMLLLIKQALLN